MGVNRAKQKRSHRRSKTETQLVDRGVPVVALVLALAVGRVNQRLRLEEILEIPGASRWIHDLELALGELEAQLHPGHSFECRI